MLVEALNVTLCYKEEKMLWKEKIYLEIDAKTENAPLKARFLFLVSNI